MIYKYKEHSIKEYGIIIARYLIQRINGIKNDIVIKRELGFTNEEFKQFIFSLSSFVIHLLQYAFSQIIFEPICMEKLKTHISIVMFISIFKETDRDKITAFLLVSKKLSKTITNYAEPLDRNILKASQNILIYTLGEFNKTSFSKADKMKIQYISSLIDKIVNDPILIQFITQWTECRNKLSSCSFLVREGEFILNA